MLDEPPAPEYIREHAARVADRFDARKNPTGYIPLCIAENHLLTTRLVERMSAVDAIPSTVLGYDSERGNARFRANLASFLGKRLCGRAIDPERMSVLAGAGSVLELAFHALCDPGDGVLVPTPSYSGFWPDLTLRDEAVIVPVHTTADEEFELTIDALEAALSESDCDVRVLLLTNPDNPTGRVLPAERVDEILRWAADAGLHVVADEVYALSVFGERPFTSVGALRPQLGDRLHIVWAFSKDFGASGLRCGVLISENDELLRAVDALAYWSWVSGHTQYLLSEIVSDEEWADAYLDENRSVLREALGRTTGALEAAAIRYVPAEAAFFVVCDLREFLTSPTWQGERDLWRRILDETQVNLTPGSACRVHEPGFFRLCYAAMPTDVVVEGVERIGRLLASLER